MPDEEPKKMIETSIEQRIGGGDNDGEETGFRFGDKSKDVRDDGLDQATQDRFDRLAASDDSTN